MRELLNQKYTQAKREELKDFLSSLFGDTISYKTERQDVSFKASYFDKDECYTLAHIELDKDMAVFEVKQRSVNDPRVTLTKDAFKLMQNKGVNNALIIFYSDDSDSWRLSLLTIKRSFEGTETSDNKRYSYLLGSGEKIKTPLDYLSKSIKDFDDLVSRFDVEVVRKEFFNHYLDLYIRLYKAIIEDKEFVALLKKENIELVSFSKNLLGKIIFLYFIQKKGWLGVKPNGSYGIDGDKDYMRSLWKDFTKGEGGVLEKKQYFYNDYLEWLFHAGLNKDNTDTNDFNEYFNKKVPFLNGGLFKEEYAGWRDHVCKISNDIFSNTDQDGILDIFDLYNFTIDEDDIVDSEMAVDPEMLGRIFEKMISISHENIDEILEAYEENKTATGRKKKLKIDNLLNKKFGAFYTPREIVHYMTKESLIAYLVNNLKGKKEEKEKQVRTLFDLKDKFLISKDDLKESHITEEDFDAIGDVIQDIDDLLRKVKILDPAVGSGAFPMGILHEISSIRYYIYGAFYKQFGVDSQEFKKDNKISMYEIKKDIILKNIYGVDISPGAIDIARLRFWLSLVVDEETPEPLPNFEFKFVCANTLIPLAEEEGQSQFEMHTDKDIKVETLRKYMMNYYKAQSNTDKKEWKEKIEKLLRIGKNITIDLYATKSERQKQLDTYKPFDSNHSSEFFDPGLMMGNSKFDIVIGNPPYIGYKGNGDIFNIVKDKAFGKKYYKKEMDYWYFFAHYGLDILHNKGVLIFITTNYWKNASGASNLRSHISNYGLNEFLDFGEMKVFDSALGQHNCIFSVNKASSGKTKIFKNLSAKLPLMFENSNLISYDLGSCFNEKNEIYFYKQEHIGVLQKIKSNNPLEDYFQIGSGIKTGSDFVSKKHIQKFNLQLNVGEGIFVLNFEEANLLLENGMDKNFLGDFYKSSDINKYFITSNRFRILLALNQNDLNDPVIYNHLKKFKQILINRKSRFGKLLGRMDLNFPNTTLYTNSRKIVTPYRSNKNKFAYVNEEFYTAEDVYFIYSSSDDYDLIEILTVLNSKLYNFYYKYNGKNKGDIMEFTTGVLKSTPIKFFSNSKKNIINELYKGLISITKSSFYDPKNPPQEQLDIEKEIDQMVYELYGLTEEEIKIVEDSIK